jgi:hypothetical protein
MSKAGVLAAVTYYQRDDIVVAGWRNIGFVFWGAQATLSSVRRMGAMSAALMKDHAKISIIQVIPDSTALPTEDAKDLLLKMTESGAPSLACLAYVMSGEGFWASAMRSYLTNVHWVRQRPFVPRILSTLEDVAAWLPSVHRERTGVDVPSEELLEILTDCMSERR